MAGCFLYRWCFSLIMSSYFKTFITLCILANICVQSLDQYPEKDYMKNMDLISSAFSFVFILEVLLKITAIGIKSYFRDKSHFFDMVIFCSSVADVVTNYFYAGLISQNNLTVLRAFRLIRLFKLAKLWSTFHKLLRTMLKTLRDIGYFSILLALFVIVYAILGMELFSGRVRVNHWTLVDDPVNGWPIYQNFDNFHWAVTTVFVLLTEDDWSHVFYEHFRAVGALPATLYFISLFIIGPRLLLNLYIAILMQNFDEDSLEEEVEVLQNMKAIVNIDKKVLGKVGEGLDQVNNKFESFVSWVKSFDYVPPALKDVRRSIHE